MVSTVGDSVVIGGNFIHKDHIDGALKALWQERADEIPATACFPNFDTITLVAVTEALIYVVGAAEKGGAMELELRDFNQILTRTTTGLSGDALVRMWDYSRSLFTDTRFQMYQEHIPDGLKLEYLDMFVEDIVFLLRRKDFYIRYDKLS